VAQDSTSSNAGGSSSQSSNITNLANVLPQTVTSLNDQLTQLTQSINYLTPASQMQAEALLANTQALGASTTARGSSGAGSTLESLASTLTGGALSPLLTGIMSLFGGGGSNAPTPLTPFYLPPTINFQAANAPTGSASQLPGADFGQTGDPRAMSQASAPQITIQVQTMDSQSFMDHSQDIAQAVRDAMLNMHSINDVITDL
jgi:hypothetical protein